ncbi:TPA: tetratricopeptide repeat protein [Candidatus Avigastranaerophilus faecigallinarum]|nr:tetratricopeptide repeat protein [Candidatus Avigastranaerophilus faecigallinarum]
MENEININLQQALDAYKATDYEKAVESFLKVLEEDKNNPNILNNIGLCYAKLAKDDLAIEYFLKALSFNPKSVQTYINLADVYYRNKNIIDAINLLENGVTLMPQEIALKHYLSRFYVEDCRYDLAMDQLFEILDIDEDNVDAYWDLGNIQFELGDYDSAAENYENVLEKVTDNAVLYYQTAITYEANDNTDKAISNHLKAISCNENFHPSYKKLGILFLARNDKESAIEYFQDYLNFDLPSDEKKNIEDIISRISN